MDTIDPIIPSLQNQIRLVETDKSRRLDGSVLKALAIFRGAIEVRNQIPVALKCYPWFERLLHRDEYPEFGTQHHKPRFEDLVSLIPGQSLTFNMIRTLIGAMCEKGLDYSIVPPDLFSLWYETKHCYTLLQISLVFGSTESSCFSPSNSIIPDKLVFLPFQTNQNNTNCTDELCWELAVVSIVGRKVLDCLICQPKASAGESPSLLEDAVAKLLADLMFNKETKTEWKKRFCEIKPISEEIAPANCDTGIWITEFCLNLLCQTPNNGWRSLLGIASNESSKKCQKFEAKKFDYDTLRLNYLSTICSLVEQSYPSTSSQSVQPRPNFHEFESDSKYHDHELSGEVNNTSGFYNHIPSAVNSNVDCQPSETYDSDLEDDFETEMHDSDDPENDDLGSHFGDEFEDKEKCEEFEVDLFESSLHKIENITNESRPSDIIATPCEPTEFRQASVSYAAPKNAAIVAQVKDINTTDIDIPEASSTRQYDAYRICQSLIDRVWSSLGPSLPQPTESLLMNSLLRHDRWITEILSKTIAFAQSQPSPRSAAEAGFSQTQLKFLIANASPSQQKMILDIILDPRANSNSIKFILGQPQWSRDMLDKLTPVDLNELHELDGIWGLYTIIATTETPEGLCTSYHYSGSSTANRTYENTFSGLAKRLALHKSLLELPLDELQRRRRQRTNVFYIHELKQLLVLFEHIDIVYQGNLSHYLDDSQRYGPASLNSLHRIIHETRPTDMPTPQWKGANRALPISQNSLMSFPNPAYLALRGVLESQLMSTKRYHLTVSDLVSIQTRVQSIFHGHYYRFYEIRSAFRRLMASKGISVSTVQEIHMQNNWPILYGIKTFLTAYNLIQGPVNGRYQLSAKRITWDWDEVVGISRSIVPFTERASIDVKRCKSVWSGYFGYCAGYRYRLLHQTNWDLITADVPDFVTIPPHGSATSSKSFVHLSIRERLQDILGFSVHQAMLGEHNGIIIDGQDRVKIRRRNKSFWPQIYFYAIQLLERDDGPGMSLANFFRLRSGSSLERYLHRVWYVMRLKGLTRQKWDSFSKLGSWTYANPESETPDVQETESITNIEISLICCVDQNKKGGQDLIAAWAWLDQNDKKIEPCSSARILGDPSHISRAGDDASPLKEILLKNTETVFTLAAAPQPKQSSVLRRCANKNCLKELKGTNIHLSGIHSNYICGACKSYFNRNGCNRPKSVITGPAWRKVCDTEDCTTPLELSNRRRMKIHSRTWQVCVSCWRRHCKLLVRDGKLFLDSTSDIIVWKPVCEVDNCSRVLSAPGSRRRISIKKVEYHVCPRCANSPRVGLQDGQLVLRLAAQNSLFSKTMEKDG